MEFMHAIVDGKTIVNVTPHAMTFQAPDNEVITVPASGIVINATMESVEVPAPAWAEGVTVVTMVKRSTEQGIMAIAAIRAAFPKAIICGSMITAEAHAGEVVSVVPAAGFERVPPAEKRMRTDMFTIF